jgi:hypothetical protein
LLVVAGLGVSVSAPAQASADRSSGCTPGAATARSARPADGPSYTDAQLRRIDQRLRRRLDSAAGERASSNGRVGATLRIAVHVHVVGGDGTRGPRKKRVLRQLRVINTAYAGGQSAASAATRFVFYLESFERVRKASWHRARIGGPEDLGMRRALRKGGPEDLNLYVLEPRDPFAQAVVLGWATPPTEARRHPGLDGVVIHQESLPGGTFTGYNRGDTAVHEIGHWLGLFHTFEGGCDGPGDLVDDTPAQSVASSACDPAKDTCTAQPGLDPVNNFMDYSVDDCMNMFTPGQVARMHDNWLAYRTP